MDKGEVEVELEDAPPAVALAALMTIPVPRRVVSTRPESGLGVGARGDGLTPSDSLAIKRGRVGRLGRLAIGSSDLPASSQLLPVCGLICENCSR